MKLLILTNILCYFIIYTANNYSEELNTLKIEKVIVNDNTEYYYKNKKLNDKEIRNILLSQNNEIVNNYVKYSDNWLGYSYLSGMLWAPSLLLAIIVPFDKNSSRKFKYGVIITSGSLLTICYTSGYIGSRYRESAINEFNNNYTNNSNIQFDIHVTCNNLNIGLNYKY
jgi:hypothetical protein